MSATETLRSEHRVIEGVLQALAEAANRLENNKPMRTGFFLDAADFIQHFADGFHHHKEEGVLFTTLAANGVPVQGGPIGVMLAEHEQGRLFTRAMRQAAEQVQAGDPEARAKLVNAARGYVQLLRQHIYKEDNILFPVADRTIQGDQLAEVFAGFANVQENKSGEPEGLYERYLGLAKTLQEEMAVE